MTEQEIQALKEIMAATVRQELEPVKSEMADIKRNISTLSSEMAGMKKDVSTIKKDVSHTRKQVDILYTWVDGIDLDVKQLKKAL